MEMRQMKDWNEIVVRGLISKSGEAFEIVVGAPRIHDGAYGCRVLIPGITDRVIHSENALSALVSALRVVETQAYGPSAALIAETTLTADDYPDLSILVRSEL
jgi:hypothetical protein